MVSGGKKKMELDSYQLYVIRIVKANPGIHSNNRRLIGRAHEEISVLVEAGYLKSTRGRLTLLKEA
jgi:hypothetical protein